MEYDLTDITRLLDAGVEYADKAERDGLPEVAEAWRYSVDRVAKAHGFQGEE